MIYAGLDVGTTNCKITIFENENVIDSIFLSYPSIRNENQQTIDPLIILKTVKDLIAKASKKYLIEGIGITSFGETCVFLDEFDQVILPSLLYTDSRGEKEAKEIEELIGKEKLGQITGQIGRGMFSLSKIIALRNEYKEEFKKVNKIFLIEDFIIYSLTKKRYIDYSLASRSLCFDINKHCWSNEILTKVDLSSELFSIPCESGSYVGDYLNIKIFAISHDQISNAIGGHVLLEGNAIDGCGTCECITIAFKEKKDVLYEKGYGVIPYINNLNVCYILNNTSGALLDWVKNTFFSSLKEDYVYLNTKIKDEPSNVLILPYFAGSSTPYMDLKAKGMICNLSLGTTSYDIYQATLESLTYEMKLSIDLLKENGICINKLYVSGGGAKNDKWMQIKADVLNLNIYQLENINSGSIGCGIVVGTKLGVFSSLEEGMDKMVKIKKIYYPNKEKHKKYLKIFNKYKRIYPLMKGIENE